MGALHSNEKIVAVVLAGGKGNRMNSPIQKQYMLLGGKPLLYYSLKAFEDSEVDEIILVSGEEEYCRTQIIDPFCLRKVTTIVNGGKERYESVYRALTAIKDCSYVLIHDAARPFLTQEIIRDTIDTVIASNACAVGMPAKDTIKIVDSDSFIRVSPDRSMVWQIQTPQAFRFDLIWEAYSVLMQSEDKNVTDDTGVLEKFYPYPVKLIKGSYRNIKVTTPEDIILAETLLKHD